MVAVHTLSVGNCAATRSLAGHPHIDWSRLAFLKPTANAHALKTNNLYQAQAVLLILKEVAGDAMPFIDEATDACAHGLIRAQYHCVTRELIVRHVYRALGIPTEATISTILAELKAEGWPVRAV